MAAFGGVFAVWRTALGLIGNDERFLVSTRLGDEIYNRYAESTGITRAQARTLSGRAVAATRAAGEMADDPSRPFGSTRLPIDPTIGPEGPRFAYRVVIEATGVDTGQRFSYAVDIPSDRPLSLDEVSAEARAGFGVEFPRQSYRETIAALGDAVELRIIPIAAGKGW